MVKMVRILFIALIHIPVVLVCLRLPYRPVLMAAQEAVQALLRAVRHAQVNEVVRLLEQDQRLLEARHDDGLTSLMWAAAEGNVSVLRALLNRGADVRAVDDEGNTALHHGAFGGDAEVVAMLVASGASLTCKSQIGKTILMDAAMGGFKAHVLESILQASGAQGLDDADASGCTALWYACWHGYPEAVRVFLLWGADHSIANNKGQTPRRTAEDYGHYGYAADDEAVDFGFQDCVRMIQVGIDRPCWA
jgi:ankyrin repeat protein